MSGDILLGTYRVVRVLKNGHAVRTLLAEDTAGGGAPGSRLVVVKAAEAPRLLPAARLRLEHEATATATSCAWSRSSSTARRWRNA